MAVNITTQIARLQRMFPEISSTVALEYLQYANRELAFDMPLYTLEEDIQPDGTNNTFTLNANDLRVWSATYKYSATYSKPIAATTLREMELDVANWRNTPENIPNLYCVYKESDDLKVMFYPSPSVAYSGGYPKITLRVSRHVDLTAISDLPTGLVVPDVFCYKAAVMYAADHGHADRVQMYDKMYHEAVVKNLQGFDFRVVDAPPKTKPAFRFPGVARR